MQLTNFIIVRRPLLTFLLGMVSALVLLSGCVSEYYPPSVNTRDGGYNASELSKNWRSQLKNKQFPADNDSDYVYPSFKNGGKFPPPPNPYGYPYIPPNPYSQPPYPRDNDAGYTNPYPRYDPEADNSAFEYPLFFDD